MHWSQNVIGSQEHSVTGFSQSLQVLGMNQKTINTLLIGAGVLSIGTWFIKRNEAKANPLGIQIFPQWPGLRNFDRANSLAIFEPKFKRTKTA